jgi:hypothetical protein
VRFLPSILLLALWAALLDPAGAQPPPAGDLGRPGDASLPSTASLPGDASDLDQLMARVLTNRDQSWRKLQEYLLDERESFRLVGPDGAPMFGSQRDFVWVARDGRAVRSPVRVNGVAVGEEARQRAEARWQADEDKRAERAASKAQAGSATTGDVEDAMRSGEPRFISEVQFLRFTFEPGNYYFVGKETLAGREVLRIEYYPRNLFSEESDKARSRRDRAAQEAAATGGNAPDDDDDDERLERALNKVSLVTLWVDPEVHQIVRYTFDNVDFNFLPGRSLVRVDTATATMTMGQPFAGVWLPASLTVEGALTLATGTYRAEYSRRFSDYRQADVQMRFRLKDDK